MRLHRPAEHGEPEHISLLGSSRWDAPEPPLAEHAKPEQISWLSSPDGERLHSPAEHAEPEQISWLCSCRWDAPGLASRTRGTWTDQLIRFQQMGCACTCQQNTWNLNISAHYVPADGMRLHRPAEHGEPEHISLVGSSRWDAPAPSSRTRGTWTYQLSRFQQLGCFCTRQKNTRNLNISAD